MSVVNEFRKEPLIIECEDKLQKLLSPVAIPANEPGSKHEKSSSEIKSCRSQYYTHKNMFEICLLYNGKDKEDNISSKQDTISEEDKTPQRRMSGHPKYIKWGFVDRNLLRRILKETTESEKKYLKTLVSYNYLIHCLSDKATTDMDSSKKKIFKDILKIISYLEIEKCGNSCRNDTGSADCPEDAASENFFDLDCTVLRKKIRSLLTQDHFELLQKLFKEYITFQCLSIISFTFPEEQSATDADEIDKVVAHVAKLKEDNVVKRSQIALQGQYNCKLISLVFKDLEEYSRLLEGLVKDHRFCEHPLSYLNLKIMSMKVHLLKVRSIELEVLSNNYTATSVPALKTLAKAIKQKKESLNNELIHLQHKLSAFEALGPEFNSLLQEYVTIQKDTKLLMEDLA